MERAECLEERLGQVRLEFAISGEVQKMFVEKEDDYKLRIATLEEQLDVVASTAKVEVATLADHLSK